MQVIAETKNLKAYYITRAYGVKRTVQAVDDISVQIRAGEIYGIAGESGCGKSTLLRVLLGQVESPLTVVGGSVTYHIDNQSFDALSMNRWELKEIRWRNVSYIPQGSMHVLNPVRKIRYTFRDFIRAHQGLSNS